MAKVSIFKKVEKIDLDKAKWSRTTNPDGSVTYTATAVASVDFWEPRATEAQEHAGVPIGKSFTLRGDTVDLWNLY